MKVLKKNQIVSILDTGAVYPELGKLSCMCIDVKENRREFFSTQNSLL